MQVITTHLNADFDCLAAMVAAHKLYPEAKMVFSGSAEKAVNRYLNEVKPAFQISRIKDINLDRVSLLVLVDTQDPRRIGVFQSLAQKPGMKVHVYDHHLDAAKNIEPEKAVIRKRGAATTILTEELTANNISLNDEESTLMALGIYEDTHSLVSISTTPEDFAALGRLVQSGADLNVVAEYIQPRLDRQQLDVMNDLIRNLETLNVNGVEIALATATAEHFVEDLAYVVHQLMELENLSALFVLVRMDRRVYLIGRSRARQIDIGQIAREFGGGGHANAASASIRELTLPQVKEKLLAALSDKAEPIYRVQDIMHFPVVSVKKKETIQAAEKTLTLFNLNTLPVMQGKKPVGLITRQIVEKAIHHKWEKEAVEDLMIREFSVTTPNAFFNTIIPIVIEEKQKLIPVVDSKRGTLSGVVSRGDLLRVLQGDLVREDESRDLGVMKDKAGHKNIKSLMKERLDKKLMRLFESIVKIANREGVSIFVVGGFVRDLLLNIPNLDIDLVVEGEGIPFAKTLGKELKGRVKSHSKFGTSVIILEDGFRIDVATARMEFYKHPAALPTVEKSSIKTDLFRRDFTINCLAIKLNNRDAFTLIDFFNGERDIKDKKVRVLHNLSFIEDPCRLFRAIRFEQRFGFAIGRQTEAFMKTVIRKKLVDQLSGSRFLNEILLILKEEKPLACLERMKAFSLLPFISPKLLNNGKSLTVLQRIEEVLTWAKMVPLSKKPEVWFTYLLGLFYDLDKRAFHRAVERLRAPARLCKRLEDDRENCREAIRQLGRKKALAPHEIYDVFSTLSPEATIFLLALSANERVNKYASLYFTHYHSLGKLSLTGDDLIRVGIKPGPVFQTVFKALRDARVSGEVKTKKEEMALVRQQFLKS